MRFLKILFTLPLLFCTGMGQMSVHTGALPWAAAAGGCPFTDDFAGTGALSASWTSPLTPLGAYTITRVSGVAQANAASAFALANNTSCTFPLDQYAQAKAVSYSGGSPSRLALAVLMSSSGSGYVAYYSVGSQGIIWKYTTGSQTTNLVGTCGLLSAGDTLKIAVTGSGGSQTLTVYINGVSKCSATDSTWTSGYPGIRLTPNDGATSVQWDNFEAD